ncbi:response regulator transcription factor [Rhodoferax sp.]|uniref:response regulator n=1 Tax=Rhodoferax sp. TaxID=50421 RepID=UPI001EBDE5E4|nr:response regulator transcription factor [Rhodoferax sp.]MBT9505100.1 response regulator transcription factor [Rhodoferax sp.]
MTLRVLLADDHLLFRSALRMSLEAIPGIEVVAEAANGRAAIDAVGLSRAEVVCMDINMPGLDGIEATSAILAVHPGVKVIGLSAHVDPVRVADMFRAGALGYVHKSHAGTELPEAILRVNQGLGYLSPELGVGDMDELMRYVGPAHGAA